MNTAPHWHFCYSGWTINQRNKYKHHQ